MSPTLSRARTLHALKAMADDFAAISFDFPWRPR